VNSTGRNTSGCKITNLYDWRSWFVKPWQRDTFQTFIPLLAILLVQPSWVKQINAKPHTSQTGRQWRWPTGSTKWQQDTYKIFINTNNIWTLNTVKWTNKTCTWYTEASNFYNESYAIAAKPSKALCGAFGSQIIMKGVQNVCNCNMVLIIVCQYINSALLYLGYFCPTCCTSTAREETRSADIAIIGMV